MSATSNRNPHLQLLGVSLGSFPTHAHFQEAGILFRKTGTYLLFHHGNLGLVLISCHQKVPAADVVLSDGLGTIMVDLVTGVRHSRLLKLVYGILCANTHWLSLLLILELLIRIS